VEHRRREPARGVFRLVLRLPWPGLDRVNAYALTDEDGGATLVDCGIYDPNPATDHGWPDLVAGLATAGLVPDQISRLIVTHHHIDHYGMAGRVLAETGCELWMHESTSEEIDYYRDPDGARESLRHLLSDHGVEPADLEELTAFEDWRGFVADLADPTRPLKGGETFTVGGREWEVVYTPGHARTHICFWARAERLLISGDHLLPTVTPHIDFHRGPERDPLGAFLASLKKIEGLDPALVLPGHGHPFEEGAERARVIERHHDRRLGSILQVIRREPHTADEITEDIFSGSLLHFQKRLALGEVLAHIAYLVNRGEIERIEREDGSRAYIKTPRRTE
jgi:glyoxylase-like metal-dependent hydrolase (beta-lactamase superfamily II)